MFQLVPLLAVDFSRTVLEVINFLWIESLTVMPPCPVR